MYFKIILLLVAAFIVIVFASNNMAQVSVSFLSWSAALPLVFVILISIIVGVLIGGVITIINNLNFTREIKTLSRKIAEQEEDLQAIRQFQIEENK